MNRQENLIQILLKKAEKPLTTQKLAEQLNVSSRTIRSDLEKIESEILVHSMKLEKRNQELVFGLKVHKMKKMHCFLM